MSYKRWILAAVLLFGIGLALGLAPLPSVPGIISEDIMALEEFADFLASLPLPLIALLIFVKNVIALLVSFIFSPLLCLAPILTLIVNGWILSLVSAAVVQKESLWYLLAGILPHGIFELPAFIIGEAAALSFGAMTVVLLIRHGWPLLFSFVRKGGIRILIMVVLFTIVGIFPTIILLALSNEQTRPIVTDNLKQNTKYLLLALALLVPAAIIETYVTPLLLA